MTESITNYTTPLVHTDIESAYAVFVLRLHGLDAWIPQAKLHPYHIIVRMLVLRTILLVQNAIERNLFPSFTTSQAIIFIVMHSISNVCIINLLSLRVLKGLNDSKKGKTEDASCLQFFLLVNLFNDMLISESYRCKFLIARSIRCKAS